MLLSLLSIPWVQRIAAALGAALAGAVAVLALIARGKREGRAEADAAVARQREEARKVADATRAEIDRAGDGDVARRLRERWTRR